MRKLVLFTASILCYLTSSAQIGSVIRGIKSSSKSNNQKELPNDHAEKISNSSSQNDEQYYYKKVKETIDRFGGYSPVIRDDISKAIELNPTNVEYRWIRARCNMNSASKEPEFNQAIQDLKVMIDLGGNNAKVYGYLGLAYEELASDIFYNKKAKKNDSFSDDDSQFIEEQSSFYQEAIEQYNKSKIAYAKAIELDPDKYRDNLKYKDKEITDKIKLVNDQISKLK